MKNVAENELFSAYLDGELTVDEQAEVEELLATDPRARHLLDELRTLSATLQSLPPRTIGRDLSEVVLRTAERRMLAESPRPLGKYEQWQPETTASWTDVFRRILRPRVILWSALAVIVAVTFTLTAPDRGDRGGLARQDDQDDAVERIAEPAPEIRAIESRAPEVAVQNLGDRDGGGVSQTAPPATSEPEEAKSGEAPRVPAVPSTAIASASEEPYDSASERPQEVQPSAAEPGDREQQEQPVPQVVLVRCEVPAKALRESGLLGMLAEKQLAAGPAGPGKWEPGQQVILIQSQGTPEQIEAAIARMKAQPEIFSSVSVQSLTGEAALAWISLEAPGSVVPDKPSGANADRSALAAGSTGGGKNLAAQPSPPGVPRYRIGATIRKTTPGASPQVRSDPKTEKTETPASGQTTSARPQPKTDEAASSLPPGELQRVIFLLRVVEPNTGGPTDSKAQ